METIELRQAIRKLYNDQSLSVSDCYKLQHLRKIGSIFYFSADVASKQLAKIIQKQVESYFFQPVLLQAVPFNLTAGNYYQGWKEMLKFISHQDSMQKSLVICNSISARILLEFASIKELSDKFFIPNYILDINEYREEDLVYWKKVPAEIRAIKEQKSIYQKKSPQLVQTLIVLMSSLECMEALSEINDFALENIILINDCDTAPQWYRRRQRAKFDQAIRKIFPQIKSQEIGSEEFKTKIASLDSSIMILPQSKTWWKYYASSEVLFLIYTEDETDMDDFGLMEFQSFCEDMAQFALTAPNSKEAQTFRELYCPKHFNCFNKTAYWLRKFFSTNF